MPVSTKKKKICSESKRKECVSLFSFDASRPAGIRSPLNIARNIVYNIVVY